MNDTLYPLPVNGSVVDIINYIDITTGFLFVPVLLLITFVVVLLNNRQDFRLGLVMASFATFVLAILFKGLLVYVLDIYIFLTLFMLIVSIGIFLFL